jgi:spectinomycin phosphotransferase
MAMRWEPGYRQAELRELLARDLDQPWEQGPYGQRAKALIVEHTAGIEKLQAWHDKLYERFQASNDPWVITHGEPHDGNTMLDTEGAIHLIDCNASLLGPRERDLRLLLQVGHQRALDVDNTEVIAAHQRGAGQPIEARPYVLDLFRAEWHLMEISGYACSFRDEHEDTAGAAGHWKALNQYLPVEQNWPNLV